MRDFLPRMIVVYILVCVYDMSYEGYAETFENQVRSSFLLCVGVAFCLPTTFERENYRDRV